MEENLEGKIEKNSEANLETPVEIESTCRKLQGKFILKTTRKTTA